MERWREREAALAPNTQRLAAMAPSTITDYAQDGSPGLDGAPCNYHTGTHTDRQIDSGR